MSGDEERVPDPPPTDEPLSMPTRAAVAVATERQPLRVCMHPPSEILCWG